MFLGYNIGVDGDKSFTLIPVEGIMNVCAAGEIVRRFVTTRNTKTPTATIEIDIFELFAFIRCFRLKIKKSSRFG